LTIDVTGSVSRTSGHIIGNLQKVFGSTGTFTFDLGTANGYSPATVNVTALAVNPSNLTIKASEGTALAAPPLDDAKSLDRFWDVTETGDLTADVTFNYLAGDVDGNEANYHVVKIEGAGSPQIQTQPVGCPGIGSFCVDAALNQIILRGATSFSTWTATELVATAAPAEVSGRVVDANGRGVYSARVTLTDSTGNVFSARTNSFGYYKVFGVPAGGTYAATVTHRILTFAPQVISVSDNVEGLNFVASTP
jgi:hypothetical protein